MPRVLRGRPWVRARLDRVEMPLKRTRKSRKARKIEKRRNKWFRSGFDMAGSALAAPGAALNVPESPLMGSGNALIVPEIGFTLPGSTLKVQKPIPRLLEMQRTYPVAQSYLRNTGRITLGRGANSSAPFFPPWERRDCMEQAKPFLVS